MVSTLGSSDGSLGRPMWNQSLWVPNDVWIERGYLAWPWPFDSGDYSRPRPQADHVLDDFLRLAEPASAEKDILGFARKYGPLALCLHDLPATHTSARTALSRLAEQELRRYGDPSSSLPWRGCLQRIEKSQIRGCTAALEPLSAWRRYARRAAALLDGA